MSDNIFMDWFVAVVLFGHYSNFKHAFKVKHSKTKCLKTDNKLLNNSGESLVALS